MLTSTLIIIPIDKEVIDNVADICTALMYSPSLHDTPKDEIEQTVLIALCEYWANADWTGAQYLLEFSKEPSDEVSTHLVKNLMYRLTDASSLVYPRLSDGVKLLSEEVKYYRKEFHIDEVYFDEKTRTMGIGIFFE